MSRSKALFLTDYRGLSVSELEELRHQIRQVNGGHVIVKNSLVALALKQAGLPVPEDLLTGPTAISVAYGEVPALAKVLADSARNTRILQVKGGILEGRVLTAAEVTWLANLPPKEVVWAQLLGLISQPGNRLAGVLNAAGGKLAATVKAYAEKLQTAEATA